MAPHDGIVIFFVDVSSRFYRGDINVSSSPGGFSVMLRFHRGSAPQIVMQVVRGFGNPELEVCRSGAPFHSLQCMSLKWRHHDGTVVFFVGVSFRFFGGVMNVSSSDSYYVPCCLNFPGGFSVSCVSHCGSAPQFVIQVVRGFR